MNPIRRASLISTHLGVRWALFRVRYALRRRMGGLIRRTPLAEWPELSHTGGRAALKLFPNPPLVGPGCIREADAILQGRFRLFSFHEVATGLPPAWHQNPLTGDAAPADRHWSQLGDFAFGDIKGIWELSRLPWAFPLARAYARTRDDRYAETFWVLLEDWMQRNPPNQGPNWMCGQEATFRLMAATFARYVCAAAPATTAGRTRRFEQLALATGRRIAGNLDYALSQLNNHGISECVGLITAAAIVPETEEVAGWRHRGLDELEHQISELVYADGTFAQHSAIYHRLLLHDLLWLMSLLRARQDAVPEWLVAAGRRAGSFIEAVVDPSTGQVPLYGANDGSNILPLADSEFLDFRPMVQAGHAMFHAKRQLPPGPWDEAADWLAGAGWSDGRKTGGPDVDPALRTPVVHATNAEGSQHFPNGGVMICGRGATRLFMRCPTRFRHRPSQADLLHVDITWAGQPIAIDAGTYSYNDGGRFADALKGAVVHNSATFDGEEPMLKAGRFLYLPWPHGNVRKGTNGFEAEHDGWRRIGGRHVRCIREEGKKGFRVEDRVTSRRTRLVRLHWLLGDFAFEHDSAGSAVRLSTPSGPFLVQWEAPPGARASVVRADAMSSRGWWSPHYFHAAPALSLVIEFECKGEAAVSTTFQPG